MKMIRRLYYTLVLLLFGLNLVAGPDNIAPKAEITASTILNQNFDAKNIVDGKIGISGIGEWACEGVTTSWGYVRFPWIQLTWPESQVIDKVVLYDSPSMNEHIAGGKLVFSDGSVVWVNQIPNNGTAKAVSFAPKTIEWVKFITTDGKGKDLGFSEIEVFPAFPQLPDYVSKVDPYIETNRGRYFFFVPGARPFGMVGTAPMTRNKNQNGGGYNYNETEILSFPQIHTWMISGIEVMPTTSDVDPRLGKQGWKSKFSHDDEIVQPGYQRVFLRDYKTWVELTATDRVTFHRFRFTENMKAQILTNLGGYVGNSAMEDASVKKINNHEFVGSFNSTDRFWGGPKNVSIYFIAQFDKPFNELNGWTGDERFDDITEITGDDTGVAAMFDVKPGDEVQMKIAVSYTSIENARENLEAECSGWDFDGVRNKSRDIWNDILGKIKVEGGTRNQQVKFYTDLWHVLLGRQKINDVNGDYPDRTSGARDGTFTDAVLKIKTLPKDENGDLKFNMYNTDALWLTQWNLNVLWGLAWPELLDEMSASMIQYAENGYLLPRGPCGGGYSYIMTSSPATNMIASAFMKNVLTKKESEKAFEMVKQNLLPGGMLGDSDEIEFYTKNGFWPGNAGITIEAAFQDFAAAQMALKLGKTKDYRFFIGRSNGWKKLFNPRQKLLFPKDENGNFIHNDPLSGAGWVEANAWQATWAVSHDISDLAELMGGNDTLCSKLNHAFEMAEPSDFVFAYNDGYVSYANQPGCSNAHVFNYAGKPWLTQYWVRRVKEQAYGGTTPDLGYGGHDEDQGQMGGVSALMAIGLFSLQGNVNTEPVYDITSPIFDKITIELDQRYYSGKSFVIETANNSNENVYIQEAFFNGEPLNTFWFSHEDFANGGELNLILGDKPNIKWGRK
ncbi:alpha-1,2-mannosidase, putative [Tangfeifania diversioriginum]|uniref:Alpha-1,2-mannosidase, putative n=2 Tax=Tangfeifania diversioriginum TaxID=1168035 RepID=A0A1M6MY94_9BACT|nr:alpha-1,2-mannosidase, putative [Tangfeifania diversioriginum]